MRPQSRTFVLILALVLSAVLNTAPGVFARQTDEIPERPDTPSILPETTVALVRIPNFRDALEKSRNTGGGQFWQDEAVASLADGLWQEAELAYQDAQDQVGVELSDFTSLPDGEMTFAVIAPRRKNPEYMLILELNDDDGAMSRVLDRGREVIAQGDSDADEETTDDGFVIEAFNIDQGPRFHFFRHENLIIGCTSVDELNFLIDRWMGRPVPKTRPLTANRKFVTIMNRCQATYDLDPEFQYFVDPIALAKSAYRGNTGAQFVIGILPLLGFDSLSAVGGTVFLDEKEYDLVSHTHILMTKPRTGIFSLLAFKPTEYRPDSFVPEDVANFFMVSIAPSKAYSELTDIVDSFYEDGFFESQVDTNINQQVGINFKEDFVDSLDGRITYIQWVEDPVIFQSVVNAIAIKLKDPERIESLMEKLLSKAEEDFEARQDRDGNPIGPQSAPFTATDYQGIVVYGEPVDQVERRNERFNRRRGRRGNEESNGSNVQMEMRFQTPCLAIIDDSLVISLDSRRFMEKLIETHQGESPQLLDNEAYARMTDQSRKLLDNELPIANFYSDPSKYFKWVVDLVNAENTQSFIADRAETNKYLAGIKQRLDENPLPEFDQLQRYFPKSGGFATDDDTGIHLLQFSMKSDVDDE